MTAEPVHTEVGAIRSTDRFRVGTSTEGNSGGGHMSGNFLEMVHRHLDELTIKTMANLLGQSRHTMRSATDQVAPALVGALAQKASTREGAQDLHASLTHVDDKILDDLPGYLETHTRRVTQSGTGIMSGLFGAELGPLIGTLATHTGLGDAGTSSVMKMLAPVVLAILARHQRRERLNALDLASFLDDQRRDVNAALPPSLTGMFGISAGRSGELGEQIGEDRERTDRFTGRGGPPEAEKQGMHRRHGGGRPSALYKEQPAPETGGGTPHRSGRQKGRRWLVPVLGLLAIVAFVYGVLQHRQPGTETLDPAVQGEQRGLEDVERKREAEPPEAPQLGPQTPPREVRPEEPGTNPAPPPPKAPQDEPGTNPAPSPPNAPQPEGRLEKESPSLPGTQSVEGAVGAEEGTAGRGDNEDRDRASTPSRDEPLFLGTLFEAGSSALKNEPSSGLDSLLQLVQDYPERDIEIRGYALGAGAEETRRLSEERADAVKRWLVERGVDETRIQAIGGGASSTSQVDVYLR